MALSDEQIVELNVELTTDPLGRGYAGLDNEQAAADMNDDYREYSKDISITYVQQLMGATRKWDNYTELAAAPLGLDPNVPNEWRAHYPGIREFMQMFVSRLQVIDFRGHPNRVAKEGNGSLVTGILTYGDYLLEKCVAEGSIGLSAADGAREQCDTTVTRSWELFDQSVSGDEVGKARAL